MIHKRLLMRLYSRVHKWPLGGWWIAERIIWRVFIRRYP